MIVLLGTLAYFSQSSTHAFPLSPFTREIITKLESPSVMTCTCADSRTTWDIVWSCIVTIFACSWVTVHPDIPAPDDKWWTITLQRIEYMIWTIMTPELMIYWAARQWFGVRYFFTYPFHGSFNENINFYRWTRTHAHFLQMGGFTLFDSNGESKGVLSRDRFRILLEKKKITFPEIKLEEIQDRSKSDGLAMVLVVGQTTWFILQVITRRIQGLVTTEIEIATLAFAALNAVMYFFWWDKPFDVRTSVPVYLISEAGSKTQQHRDNFVTSVPEQSNVGIEINEACKVNNSPTSKDTRPPINFVLRILIWWPWRAVTFVAGRLHNITENFREFNIFQNIESPSEIAPGRVPQFYAIIATEREEIKMNVMVAILGAVFGAIHCAAWFFTFPSGVERNVWRIGSLIITCVPLAFLALMVTVGGVLKPSSLFRSGNKMKIFIQVHIIPIFFRTLAPLYAFSRLALVVEALVALRNLPEGAFDVVKWQTFIPHI